MFFCYNEDLQVTVLLEYFTDLINKFIVINLLHSIIIFLLL